VWSHDDCDYSICEGGDTRFSTGKRLPGWVASPTVRAAPASRRGQATEADGITSSRHHHVERASVVTIEKPGEHAGRSEGIFT
jgi:hypothetical protein